MSSLLKQYLGVSQMEEAKPLSNVNEQITSTEEMSNSENLDDQKIQNLPPPQEELQNNEQKLQFENVVAIVDPPRSGLHPAVIKALRTHPRLRRLV